MKIKSKDLETFDALYDEYADKVYRMALSSSRNYQTAEDVTQIIFMKLYQQMNNINLEKIEAWLIISTKNQVTDYMRKHKNECLIEDIDQFVDEYEDEIVSDTVILESLESSIIKKLTIEERKEFVYKIYSELYEKDKRWYEAIMTTYILEKPQKEVAKMMGISLGALELILFRARNWIKKQYQKQFEHLDKI